MTFLTDPLRSWRQHRRDRQHAERVELHEFALPVSRYEVDVECDAGWNWPQPNAYAPEPSVFEALLLAQHAARDALLH